MQLGVYVPTFGDYDVRTLAALAAEAEAAGWDGFFIWDHLLWAPVSGVDIADTTVALTAIALATERVRFGALVTPLARRRPWKLAKETATLDRLSRGRLVVGVGLGAQGDVAPFGEGGARRALAKVLDEGLDLLTSLWSGEPITHIGEHFAVRAAALRPTPLQARIPIWVAGFWPNRPPFRRAARFDGALPLMRGHLMKELSPAELRRCRDYIDAHRASSDPFDLVAFAATQPRTPDTAAEYGRPARPGESTRSIRSPSPSPTSVPGSRAVRPPSRLSAPPSKLCDIATPVPIHRSSRGALAVPEEDEFP